VSEGGSTGPCLCRLRTGSPLRGPCCCLSGPGSAAWRGRWQREGSLVREQGFCPACGPATEKCPVEQPLPPPNASPAL